MRGKINVRIVVFVALIVLVPGWLMYTYFSDLLHKGVVGQEGDYTRVELRWMSTFEFNQTTGTIDDVPRRWRELDGKKVILTGEIWAPNSAGPEITAFDLCYSIAKCCFTGPPQVQHFVKSRAVNGPVPNYAGQVEVRGTLHVNVIPGPEKIDSVYQLDVESVTLPDQSFPMWIVWGIGGFVCVAGAAELVRRRMVRRLPVGRPAAQLNPLSGPSEVSNISRIPTQT
jgi:hypothetical protein